jgi:hypothetical protein
MTLDHTTLPSGLIISELAQLRRQLSPSKKKKKKLNTKNWVSCDTVSEEFSTQFMFFLH